MLEQGTITGSEADNWAWTEWLPDPATHPREVIRAIRLDGDVRAVDESLVAKEIQYKEEILYKVRREVGWWNWTLQEVWHGLEYERVIPAEKLTDFTRDYINETALPYLENEIPSLHVPVSVQAVVPHIGQVMVWYVPELTTHTLYGWGYTHDPPLPHECQSVDK